MTEVLERPSIAATNSSEHQPAPAPQPEQLVRALNTVALYASILLDLINDGCTKSDAGGLMETLEASRVMAATIGSLADGFASPMVRGDQYDWHVGFHHD